MPLPSASSRPPIRLWGALILTAMGLGLAGTNPTPAEFEAFASERMVDLVIEEVCAEDGLPSVVRLLIQDCPALVRSQSTVLGRLAREHTRRINLGLFSIYRTEIGGQRPVPQVNWRFPRYRAITVAAAGQFLILRAGEDQPGGVEP